MKFSVALHCRASKADGTAVGISSKGGEDDLTVGVHGAAGAALGLDFFEGAVMKRVSLLSLR